jgi:hypothetical protein
MTAERFDDEIRRFIRARPFQPFSMVMDDGRLLHVERPKVAFNNGGAAFVDADGEIQFVECEQVRDFRPSSEEFAK